MKNFLLTMILTLAFGTTTPTLITAKQNNPAGTPAGTELTDTTRKDGLEVFSDTTAVAEDSTLVSSGHRMGGSFSNGTVFFDDVFDSMSIESIKGMVFVIVVLFILFVLAPILFLVVLFYFLQRNRRQKMKLAQMAMEQGQPIPDRLLVEEETSADTTYQRGLRQMFLGVGLMVFLGYAAGHVGFGIGALVFFIGLGKVVIAKTDKTNREY